MAKCATNSGFAQVLVEVRELPGRQQALVHNRARRKRSDITPLGQERFERLRKQREVALEFCGRIGDRGFHGSGFDEKLPDFRHGLKRALAQRIRIGRNFAPARETQLAAADSFFDGALRIGSASVRREEHPDPKTFAKRDLQFGGAGAHESNRQATENSSAVAAGAVGIHTATVRKALESLQCKLQDFVGGRSGEACNETCTTGNRGPGAPSSAGAACYT